MRVAEPTSHSSRVKQIREAALELWASQGYHATSIKEIASVVGIRDSSLYSHLTSKEQLLNEILTDHFRALIAAHEEAVAGVTDPSQRLWRATNAHVMYNLTFTRQAILGNSEIRSLNAESRQRIMQLWKDYERRFRSIIDAGRTAGVFDTEVSGIAALAILTMGRDAAFWYRSDGPLGRESIASHYADMALRAVGASSVKGSTAGQDGETDQRRRVRHEHIQ
jgi:AcrR family transcriptional regulator